MDGEDRAGHESKKPEGIGGWLLVPIIGLFFSIYQAFEIIKAGEFLMFEPEMWRAFVSPGTVFYHSFWVPAIVSLAILQLAIMMMSIAALISIFKKKRFVPHLMITVYAIGVAMMINDYLLAARFFPLISVELAEATQPESMKKLIGVSLAALVWTPYFMRSRRVKNTFVK